MLILIPKKTPGAECPNSFTPKKFVYYYEPMEIIPRDHTYYLPNNSTPCYACQDKSNLVTAPVSKINKWTLENNTVEISINNENLKFTRRKVKTDATMKFYTEIKNIVLIQSFV